MLVNPELLVKYDVTLKDVERAVAASNANATGGYLNIGSNEYLVRGLGRLKSLDELNNVVVNTNVKRPVLLRQVARIIEGAQVKRGDSSVNGEPAVILTISKQPGIDTRTLTDRITAALADLQPSSARTWDRCQVW